MKKKNSPFYFITISIFILLIVPVLIQDGMFMDGIQYACISKNLAHGLGTFWHPFLSSTWNKNGSIYFLEHPPLVYGIQSIFFTIIGDSIYAERIYSFTTAIVTAILIILIWKIFFRNNEDLKSLAWLAVLLWIIIPICSWSYQNNIQENTMGVFTILSVYFSLKAVHLKEKQYWNLFLSGISIFLATFSKGVPGLFPIATIIIYWTVFRSFSFNKIFLNTLILLATPLLIYFILMQNHTANNSLLFYFKERLLFRINEEPTVSNRYFIFFRLFSELIPTMLIALIVLILSHIRKIKNKFNSDYKKTILFFFLIGISGSLPIMLTLVQRGFYFLPALPFFAIGFALLVTPTLMVFVENIGINTKLFKYLKMFSIFLLIFCIIYSCLQIGKKSRDKEILDDVYTVGKIIPEKETIGIDSSMFTEWSLKFYLLRYFNICSTPSKNNQYKYYLHEKKNDKFLQANFYKKLQIETKKYDLYELK